MSHVDIDKERAPRKAYMGEEYLRRLQRATDSTIDRVLEATYDNLKIVKNAADLSGDLDSSILYMLDGNIDMGDTPIIVPEGGLSLAGLNGARDPFGLYSSADNYEMFISPVGGYSGDLVMESLTIEVNGTGSQVFNLDNDGNQSAIDITGVNFTNCTSLGELTDYRQLLLNNVGFISIDDGLTFNGTWTGIAVTTSIVVSFPAATLFKEGTSFTVNNIRSDINFLSANASSVLFDFQESNVTSKGGFSLTNVRTTATNAIPNFPSDSEYARFRNCSGFRNTYVSSKWYLSSETETTVALANTPYKIAGTTTEQDGEWFDNPASNQTRYIGGQKIAVKIECRFTMTGTNGDQIVLSLWRYDDSAATFVMIGTKSPPFTMDAAGRAEAISFDAIDDIDPSDYYEVRAENTSAARNFTLKLNSTLFVGERAS